MSRKSLNRTYLDAVAEVAILAGDFAMRYYRSNLDIEIKGDGSPVTLADKGAEQAARDFITKKFPRDGILGEEFGTINPEAQFRWIVDPIDGTKDFVRSVPLWGTLVAVAEGDSVIAGCAYFPAAGEIVTAAIGEGCFWNDSKCSVSQVSDLSQATVLTTDSRFPDSDKRRQGWAEMANSAAVARTWGDCYGYMLVATGRAEVMVDDIVSPWDAAAIYPIITEAGGVITNWKGEQTAFGGDLIATNGALSEQIRKILI